MNNYIVYFKIKTTPNIVVSAESEEDVIKYMNDLVERINFDDDFRWKLAEKTHDSVAFREISEIEIDDVVEDIGCYHEPEYEVGIGLLDERL